MVTVLFVQDYKYAKAGNKETYPTGKAEKLIALGVAVLAPQVVNEDAEEKPAKVKHSKGKE